MDIYQQTIGISESVVARYRGSFRGSASTDEVETRLAANTDKQAKQQAGHTVKAAWDKVIAAINAKQPGSGAT